MSVYLDTSNVCSIVCHFRLVASTTNGKLNKKIIGNPSIEPVIYTLKTHIRQLITAAERLNISKEPVVWPYIWHIFAQRAVLSTHTGNQSHIIDFFLRWILVELPNIKNAFVKYNFGVELHSYLPDKAYWISVNQCMYSESLQHTPVWVNQVHFRKET